MDFWARRVGGIAKTLRAAQGVTGMAPHPDAFGAVVPPREGEGWSEGARPDMHHGRHRRKLAISFSPSFWLFSGWNWVPAMLPRAIIAVIGPP